MVFVYPAEKELKPFYGYLRIFIGMNCSIVLFIQAVFVTFRSLMNQSSAESEVMLNEFSKPFVVLTGNRKKKNLSSQFAF